MTLGSPFQRLHKDKKTITDREKMSEDTEKTRRLITFKKKLEERAQQLDSDLKEVQTMLETVNSLLLEKGFKRMEIPRETAKTGAVAYEGQIGIPSEPTSEPASAPHENLNQLKTIDGEPLAELIVNEAEESLRVVPAPDRNFNINTPPFTHFLVERVLQKMQERDNELAKTGQITRDRVFSYDIMQEDNIIREIFIRNIGPDRLKELRSSIRWTFEKMYEKMKSPD
jgi:hypothetical protein